MQIYLSAWSLKENIQKGNPSLKDLPEFAVRHGFSGIELMDRQILFDHEYLEDLKRRCQEAGCGVILDVSSDLTHLDKRDWLDQIAYVQNMLDAAKQLGADKVRICLGGQSLSFQKIFTSLGRTSSDRAGEQNISRLGRELIYKLASNKIIVRFAKNLRRNRKPEVKNEALKIRRAIQALKKILPTAERYEIPLVIENHWGISSRPENILQVVDELDSPYVGTCPDFDNFPKEIDPYEGLRILSPKALHVHAKSSDTNANGKEGDIVCKRCLRILKDSGYADTITVEYEGTEDPIQGCLRTRDLILKYW